MGSEEDQKKMAEGLSWKSLGSFVENPYVLALDVGTTTIRCHIYDKHAQIKGSGFRKVSNYTIAVLSTVMRLKDCLCQLNGYQKEY